MNKDIHNKTEDKKDDNSFTFLMILVGALGIGVVLIVLKVLFEF